MRIAVVGGGPAGLYFALLRQKSHPDDEICVFERYPPDSTFGFGVVFSDATLETFERHDSESYRAIRDRFAYWDDIEIHFKGSVHRIGGNGFCGCARRTLLDLLARRCRELGAEIRYETEIADEAQLTTRYDLVVIADGINSRVRERHREHFGTTVDLRPNKFTWMGSTRAFDAFTYFFRETEHGIFIAHCYQYQPGASTWVLETDPVTWRNAGLDQLDEEPSARFLERVFATELQGHPLLTNSSHWRSFPTIRNRRWVKDNMVLLGDAKASAHFTIGSGTKLAMEDAIALSQSLDQGSGVADGLARFQTDRRNEVERTQYSADTSLTWFEHVPRYWHLAPETFTFGLMTRAKAITYDNLRLRAPAFVDAVDRRYAQLTMQSGLPVPAAPPPMFLPFKLRELRLANRVVVSPMCMYSAKDGLIDDFHLVHYGARGLGGAGLMFTEMVCVAADARITPGCAGLWNDAQELAWRRIVGFVHANSETKVCLQLGHAGRKGATRLMWDGMDRPLGEGAWETLAPSPLPYFPDSVPPRAATTADLARIMAEFVAAGLRAERAGFDMLELHCAHGYLLGSFLSPLTNHRTDQYGSSPENRLRFPLAVFRAMRERWPRHKPMSVRLSATDWKEGGITGEDAVAIARAFAEAGCDLIDVSSGQTVADAEPVYGRMFQTPFSDQIRNEARLATMCVGSITSADQINTIIAAGRADLVALGRPHLADPSFTLRAAAHYGIETVSVPRQYEPGRSALLRTMERERQDLMALRLKARPKQHANPSEDS